jgi:hypothetical protein
MECRYIGKLATYSGGLAPYDRQKKNLQKKNLPLTAEALLRMISTILSKNGESATDTAKRTCSGFSV